MLVSPFYRHETCTAMEIVTRQHLGRYMLHPRQGHTNRYLKLSKQSMDCADSLPITPNPSLRPFKSSHTLQDHHGLYLTWMYENALYREAQSYSMLKQQFVRACQQLPTNSCGTISTCELLSTSCLLVSSDQTATQHASRQPLQRVPALQGTLCGALETSMLQDVYSQHLSWIPGGPVIHD